MHLQERRTKWVMEFQEDQMEPLAVSPTARKRIQLSVSQRRHPGEQKRSMRWTAKLHGKLHQERSTLWDLICESDSQRADRGLENHPCRSWPSTMLLCQETGPQTECFPEGRRTSLETSKAGDHGTPGLRKDSGSHDSGVDDPDWKVSLSRGRGDQNQLLGWMQ